MFLAEGREVKFMFSVLEWRDEVSLDIERSLSSSLRGRPLDCAVVLVMNVNMCRRTSKH